LSQSIDIDSVYFSRLKRPKHSQQYSPISWFSRRISDFRLEYSTSVCIDLSNLDSIKIDFLYELYEKSIFHIIKLILNNLLNRDYV
jgi:hypothetical protein